mmetsp:Transcript_82217/g.172122  ORF Transcript_82217/g.172122 Transcript_82217/m.172122 type:complete len:261 (+) Transcript_82217:41-823(+)|eukprot:CAMPEP_0206419338 /NCGR_PEP_ID=MMETSP0324_2-20121206/35_1 /ASSEMBLY_ACC=CAM_ASM_000836 /TAXON_ID=2866 /ORGANISM="Crypthecodinium cohnii, Strain Seligo" /LENGTH=260 /DNA_ID=CAMNT_0053882707 /DNA_START=25 /DNA_END=807 /DNA_ORIENTATION=+
MASALMEGTGEATEAVSLSVILSEMKSFQSMVSRLQSDLRRVDSESGKAIDALKSTSLSMEERIARLEREHDNLENKMELALEATSLRLTEHGDELAQIPVGSVLHENIRQTEDLKVQLENLARERSEAEAALVQRLEESTTSLHGAIEASSKTTETVNKQKIQELSVLIFGAGGLSDASQDAEKTGFPAFRSSLQGLEQSLEEIKASCEAADQRLTRKLTSLEETATTIRQHSEACREQLETHTHDRLVSIDGSSVFAL